MLKRFVIFTFSLLLCSSAFAERIEFDMSVFGFTFGKMILTKKVVNDSTVQYTLNAKGKTDFLWMKREEESIFEVEYRNGKLYSSDYEYLNKGKVEKWSTVRYNGAAYKVVSNEGERVFNDALDYSLIKLYFEPESDRNVVFCEEDCSYATLERKKDKLNVKCQDRSRSTYHVKDGRVEAMEIHLAVATVKLTRVN